MNWLYVVAIALQAADAANTCHMMKNHNGVEKNVLMINKSCEGIITQKAVSLAIPAFVNHKKAKKFLLIYNGANGAIGLGVSLSLK